MSASVHWAEACVAYSAAVAAEADYDKRVWMPAYEAENAGGPAIPAEQNDQIERLQDIRCNAEDVLLRIPAASMREWAVKFLICFDNGRDMNGLTEDLCSEAKRLLGIVDDGEDEMTSLEKLAGWAVGIGADVA